MDNHKDHYDRLSDWAENEMQLKPGSTTALRGAAAAERTRAMLTEAGVDPDELRRLIGGRPPLDPAARPGQHAKPRQVRLPGELDSALMAASESLHMNPSTIMRNALAQYLRVYGKAS